MGVMARILVIDDEEDVRTVMKGVLQSAGHEVACASDGEQGLATLRRSGANLVLTDILMPEKEGLETIREIKEQFPSVKVIAMSGGGRKLRSTGHLFTADELGANAVLRKPFDAAVLLKSVEDVLRAA